MNLNKKKRLATRTLGVGKARIVFVAKRLDEIKDAITKNDIRDLVKAGAIKIKNISGRKTVEKRRKKRGQGKIKKKLNARKRNYVILTRKFRAHIKTLKDNEKITKEQHRELRKKIKNKEFSNLNNLREHLKELKH